MFIGGENCVFCLSFKLFFGGGRMLGVYFNFSIVVLFYFFIWGFIIIVFNGLKRFFN